MPNREAYDRIKERFILALDFDGTLVDRGDWPNIGPDLGSKPYLKLAEARGVEFILYTLRDGQQLQDALDYCRDVLEINVWHPRPRGQDEFSVSDKPYYTMLIDDRCLGAPHKQGQTDRRVIDWDVMGPMLIEEINRFYNGGNDA